MQDEEQREAASYPFVRLFADEHVGHAGVERGCHRDVDADFEFHGGFHLTALLSRDWRRFRAPSKFPARFRGAAFVTYIFLFAAFCAPFGIFREPAARDAAFLLFELDYAP